MVNVKTSSFHTFIREFEGSCNESLELRSGSSKPGESGSNVEESESDTDEGKKKVKAE